MSEQVREGDVCIDATAGNGNDTVYLARLAGETGCVHAIDIQKQAIENTEKLLKTTDPEKHLDDRTVLHLMSHENIRDCAPDESVSMIVFNFGYLPGGDHSISTEKETSLKAVSKSLQLLKPEGVLLLCIYSGGDTGYEERDALLRWAEELDPRRYLVLKTEYANRRNDPPIPVAIVRIC